MKLFPWILMHPNIPKPLHGMAPRVILGEEWWRKTKRESKQSLHQHCWSCGVHKSEAKYHKWLEAHECYSINYKTGEVRYAGTAALCHACHNYIHDGRCQMLVAQDEMTFEKYEDIISRGNKLLRQWVEFVGGSWIGGKVPYESTLLFRKYNHLINSDKIAWADGDCKWEDFHMVVGGERHERNHKTYDDWLAYHDSFSTVDN